MGSLPNLYGTKEFEEERIRSVRRSVALSLKNDVVSSFNVIKPASSFGLRNARKRKILASD